MPGLRVHHPTHRSCVLLVPHPGKGFARSSPKDVRIHLDENGDTIISEGVWQELLESKQAGLSDHEWVILNEVPDPPTLLTSANSPHPTVRTYTTGPDGTIVDADLQAVAQQFAPKGIKPRITGA